MDNRVLDYISRKKYQNSAFVLETETFAEMTIRLCESRDVKSSRVFSACTFLSKDIYNKMKADKNYLPKENTAYSICFGLRLTFAEASCLLQKARYSLVPTSPDDNYRELLVEMLVTGFTYIPDCNTVLEHYGFRLLSTAK